MARMIYIAGGLLFLASLIAHLCVRITLRPKDDSDLDDYYYEFEDEHPGYARYDKWLKITMGGAAAGMLMFFAAVSI